MTLPKLAVPNEFKVIRWEQNPETALYISSRHDKMIHDISFLICVVLQHSFSDFFSGHKRVRRALVFIICQIKHNEISLLFAQCLAKNTFEHMFCTHSAGDWNQVVGCGEIQVNAGLVGLMSSGGCRMVPKPIIA